LNGDGRLDKREAGQAYNAAKGTFLKAAKQVTGDGRRATGLGQVVDSAPLNVLLLLEGSFFPQPVFGGALESDLIGVRLVAWPPIRLV